MPPRKNVYRHDLVERHLKSNPELLISGTSYPPEVAELKGLLGREHDLTPFPFRSRCAVTEADSDCAKRLYRNK
jgi:hypothetical protein